MTTGASALPLARASSGLRVTSPWATSRVLASVSEGAEVSCAVDGCVAVGDAVVTCCGFLNSRISRRPAIAARRKAMTISRTMIRRWLRCGGAPGSVDGSLSDGVRRRAPPAPARPVADPRRRRRIHARTGHSRGGHNRNTALSPDLACAGPARASAGGGRHRVHPLARAGPARAGARPPGPSGPRTGWRRPRPRWCASPGPHQHGRADRAASAGGASGRGPCAVPASDRHRGGRGDYAVDERLPPSSSLASR